MKPPYKVEVPPSPWPPNLPWIIRDAQDREVARTIGDHNAILVCNALNGFRDEPAQTGRG